MMEEEPEAVEDKELNGHTKLGSRRIRSVIQMHGGMLLKHAAVEYQDFGGRIDHLRVKTVHFFQFAQPVPVWQVACLVTPVELRSGVRTSTHMEWARAGICPSAGVVEWCMWYACGAEVGWQDQHTHGTPGGAEVRWQDQHTWGT